MPRRPPDILRGLTDAQREAVTHVDGPLLVLAGAGTGKTRVITRRVAYLLAQGVPPQAILAVTFTNKAAGEMRERIAALTAARALRVSTFHAFCARELRRLAEPAGLSPSYTIYDTADRTRLIRECLLALDFDTSQMSPSAVESTLSRAKNKMIDPERYAEAAAGFYQECVAKVYARYEREMRTRGALDFDDLLLRMVRLLADDEEVRSALEDRFRYVLVDEYQDTNAAQYRIIRLLTRTHANLCVTGDPDQAIYGWRGADIGNILSFERDYPGAKTVRLERNYRSTKTVLAAAGDLIRHNEMRKKKSLLTRNPQGSRINFIEAEDELSEAALVVSRIEALIAEGTPPADVAVFYRINALSRTLETALRKASVPYRVVAGVAFYERKEVRDLLAYVRLLANPGDDLACERVVNVPTRGIGKVTLDHVKTFAAGKGLSLLEALGRAEEIEALTPQARAAVASFVELTRGLAALAGQRPTTVLKAVLDGTAYLKLFGRSEEDRQRARNVEELTGAAADFEETTEDATLQGFLDEAALVSDQDGLDEKSPTVSLMTLHAAKGLEFPHVFIVGLEDGMLPHERSQDSAAELEEERRLLYVGMTRAKRGLTMSFALRRRRFGEFTPCEPSPFLDEISPKYIEWVDAEPETTQSIHWRQGSRPDESPEATDTLAVGDIVKHPLYGFGKVQSTSGHSDGLKAVVHFDAVGPKTLMVAYANLEKRVAK